MHVCTVLTNKLPVGDVGCCAQQSDQSEVVVHLWCPEKKATVTENERSEEQAINGRS